MFEKELNVRLVGTVPLLMHNKRTANPLDPMTRQLSLLSGKRKKSKEELIELSKLEFMAALNVDDDGNYIIPCEQIEMMIACNGYTSCRISKNDSLCSIAVENPFILDSFDGPAKSTERVNDPDCLDVRSVVISKKRIMRTRPIFRNWTAIGTIYYGSPYDESRLKKVLERSQDTGLGDFRPKFGRFLVEYF
jgi:hypothetical protein